MSLNSKKSSSKQKSNSKAVNVSGAKKTSLLIKVLVVLVVVFVATVVGTYVLDKTTANRLKAKAGSVNVKQIWEAGDGDGDGRIMKIVACNRGGKTIVIFGKDTEYRLYSGIAYWDQYPNNGIKTDNNEQWWGNEVYAREIPSAPFTRVLAGLADPVTGKTIAHESFLAGELPNCDG